MTYGPISSAANIGTSMLSSQLSPTIFDYLTKEMGFSPSIAKALSAAAPAIAAGGIGAATSGDRYGWLNALPAGIMGYMGAGGEEASPQHKAQLAEAKNYVNQADPASIAKGKSLGADVEPVRLPFSGMPSTEDVYKTPDILKTAQAAPAATADVTKAPTEGGGDSMGGIFGSLGKTPEGKLMMAMMLANMTSSLGTTASTDAYYNKLNRNTAEAERIQRANQMRYINSALGYAAGGAVPQQQIRNPEQMYPQSMIPKADKRMGAAPLRREVIDGPQEGYKHGELVGPGDGMSDSIPANIDGKRKAKVATGEYVVPRDIAEKYGNKLNAMMKAVRKAAHPKKGEQVKQDAGKRAFIKTMTGVHA